MSTSPITFSQHLSDEEGLHHYLPGGELSRFLMQIVFAAKTLAREIGRAALVGRLGLVGDKNATGDSQKKLDVYANQVVVDSLSQTGLLVAGILSEELEQVKEVSPAGHYLVAIDPLDGSSNTDINGAVGTIFGVYRRPSGAISRLGSAPSDRGGLASEMLRQGSEQVVAGYVMYGTSTMLVYTAGHGVHGFTLDRDLGEFLLSHENIRCPGQGRYYSANLGHFYEWGLGIRKYVEYLEESDLATRRPYSLRYTGALVADVHRSLIEGGIYFYPSDASHRDGKLRLLYECSPLAFVVEQAGGRASTGTTRILDLSPQSIHQRSPLVIGSSEDVSLYEKFATDRPKERSRAH